VTSPVALEPVIGLEVHVQLATRTKLFCADAATFGDPPNSNVCPVCLGLPGALPVTNAAAVELAVRAALGLGCDVHETSMFARKNYFYPDLPKGYQITQFDRPLATAGALDARITVQGEPVGEPAAVRIRRLHLEEDAGKSLHDRFAGATAVDLNRAGVPLIEIVTEPDIPSPQHARAWLTHLRQILMYLEVSDCDMEKGSLRVDANVSVRPAGSSVLGTKTEVKNMNSFANVERALAFEVERQLRLLGRGGQVVHETLLWDAARGVARPLRSKEESHDYRYFPEPDLPPLVLPAGMSERVRAALPELPAARARRLRARYSLPVYNAEVLTATRALADYYEATVAAGAEPRAASNWVMTDVLAWLNQRQVEIAALPITPAALAGLVGIVADGTISSGSGRRVFARMAETGRSAATIVAEEGLAQIADEAQLVTWADDVLARFPEHVQRYRAGDRKLLGYFMGELMRRSAGRADPNAARRVLQARLTHGSEQV
jgi:aspartyl-tRNA(Asn)/glutamyl-tRNA(Gln) amidotransferase subunit B